MLPHYFWGHHTDGSSSGSYSSIIKKGELGRFLVSNSTFSLQFPVVFAKRGGVHRGGFEVTSFCFHLAFQSTYYSMCWLVRHPRLFFFEFSVVGWKVGQPWHEKNVQHKSRDYGEPCYCSNITVQQLAQHLSQRCWARWTAVHLLLHKKARMIWFIANT